MARLEAADAVQTKGRGFALRRSRYWLIAACRLTIEWKLPRRIRWRVSAEENVSTPFSHDLGKPLGARVIGTGSDDA